MRKSIALTIAILPLALCRPGTGGNPVGFSSGTSAPTPKTKTTCSANTNDAVPDWAADPGWSSTMLGCLAQLNNDNWNGAECQPVSANGTKLGPTFGFWKGEDHWDSSGSDCYSRCSTCLENGINATQAVTTTCEYEDWTGLESNKQHCDMGFTYGT